jgi:hypothetical protein
VEPKEVAKVTPEKKRNYVGLLFAVPVCLAFFWPEYWARGFELVPKRTALFDVLADMAGGPAWSNSRTAIWLWWGLLLLSLGAVWRWRAALGGLLIRAHSAV